MSSYELVSPSLLSMNLNPNIPLNNDDELHEWVAFKPNLFKEDSNNVLPSRESYNKSITTGKSKLARFSNKTTINLASTNRAKFLVGFNRIDNVVAVTYLEESRRVTHNRPNSWATLLRIEDLIELNNDLSLICPKITEHFTEAKQHVSELESNTNSSLYFIRYLFGLTPTIDEAQIEQSIQNYLQRVVELCGFKLAKLMLFERHLLDDCEENLQSLQLQGYENWVSETQRDLNEILEMHKTANNLLTRIDLYKLEDKTVSEYREALSELYMFQLKPFIAMREIAFEQMEQAQLVLETEDFGERVKKEAQEQLEKSSNDYLTSTGAIHQIYLDYYRQNVELLKGQISRTLDDKKQFGKNAYRLKGAKERLVNLQISCSQEKIKYLNCRKSMIESRLENFQLTTSISMSLSSSAQNELVENENIGSITLEIDIELIDCKMAILVEEKLLYELKLTELGVKLDLSNSDDNNEFYDTVESPEDLSIVEHQLNMEDHNLRTQINFLKQNLIRNGRRRAHLRTKKMRLIKQRLVGKEKLHDNNVPNYTCSTDSNLPTFLLRRSNSICSLTSNSSSTSTLRKSKNTSSSLNLSEQEKMDKFRRETLNRLRRFKMKKVMEFDDNETENKNNMFDTNQEEETTLITQTSEEKQNKSCVFSIPINETKAKLQNLSSISTLSSSPPSPPPPPPPPPPPLPPITVSELTSSVSPQPIPPPPPPPPPQSLFALSSNPQKGSTFAEMINQSKKNLTKETTIRPETKSSLLIINPNEILKMRTKLKSIGDHPNKRPSLTSQSDKCNNINELLRFALKRVKDAKVHSDSESDNDDGRDNSFSDFEA